MADRPPYVNGVLGGTPLVAERLNAEESDLQKALQQLARDPSQLFAGAITTDPNGAPVSASVIWPDGATGVYSGTPSPTFPGAVDAYTVTRSGTPVKTFTQPAATRDVMGNVINRPPLIVT